MWNMLSVIQTWEDSFQTLSFVKLDWRIWSSVQISKTNPPYIRCEKCVVGLFSITPYILATIDVVSTKLTTIWPVDRIGYVTHTQPLYIWKHVPYQFQLLFYVLFPATATLLCTPVFHWLQISRGPAISVGCVETICCLFRIRTYRHSNKISVLKVVFDDTSHECIRIVEFIQRN